MNTHTTPLQDRIAAHQAQTPRPPRRIGSWSDADDKVRRAWEDTERTCIADEARADADGRMRVIVYALAAAVLFVLSALIMTAALIASGAVVP